MLSQKTVKIIKNLLPIKIFNLLLFVKKIPTNIISYFLEKKYAFLNKYSKNCGLVEYKRRTPIIMSTTTFPARINKAYLPIETILRQTIKPDKIYLWLANNEFPLGESSLPENLVKLKRRGLEIKFTRTNLRSNNKLFHSLNENPDAIIITFDDDCFYPKTYIEKLYAAHKKHPKDIIGYDAMQIKTDKKGMPLPYNTWFDYERTNRARDDTFLLSVNGILYPPKTMPLEAFNKKVLLKISLFNDDVWFKAMALLKGIKHRRLYVKNKQFLSVLDTQQLGLNNINVIKNRNDQIIKQVFEYYKLSRFFAK